MENETQTIASEVDARLHDHEHTETIRHKKYKLKIIREECKRIIKKYPPRTGDSLHLISRKIKMLVITTIALLIK